MCRHSSHAYYQEHCCPRESLRQLSSPGQTGVCACSMIYNTCLYTPCTHHLPSSSMKLGTAKVNPTDYEQSVIDALNADASPKVETKKHKRKKARGPNPLSVRKSKKLPVSQTPVSAGVVNKSKVSWMDVSLAFFLTCIKILGTALYTSSYMYL